MLWQTLVSTRASASAEEANIDNTLLQALAECYSIANEWDTRRQISVMVDKISLKSLQRYLPNLTPYRFKSAKQHLLLHGRGCPVPKPTQKRMCAPPGMVHHFISFITSQHVVQDLPFGQKKLTLSSGEVLIVPNVIQNIILERIVSQYQEYCKEADIACLSRSSLLHILDVCSASEEIPAGS